MTTPARHCEALREGGVDLPAGPKSPPDRPGELTAATAAEYAVAYERAYLYNELHEADATRVRVDCSREPKVSTIVGGFAVGLQCGGNATYNGGDSHASVTGRLVTYLVTHEATLRRPGTPGEVVPDECQTP